MRSHRLQYRWRVAWTDGYLVVIAQLVEHWKLNLELNLGTLGVISNECHLFPFSTPPSDMLLLLFVYDCVKLCVHVHKRQCVNSIPLHCCVVPVPAIHCHERNA